MQRKILITQSNYIPWKGYFDNLSLCDIFVVYDDMQYTKRDWRNRNLIKTPSGLKWLSIPVEVKGKFHQKIRDTKISDSNWKRQHWETLKHAYSKAKFFKEIRDWLEPLYLNCNFEFLTDINLHFINEINRFLEITVAIRQSSEFTLAEDRNERLVAICTELQATEYITGPAAKAYIDETLFAQQKITIHYSDYSDYPEYNQLYPPFEHGVSILDLLFCEGNNSRTYLKNLN